MAWNNGAGERTVRAQAEEVRANEQARQSNRLEAGQRKLNENAAMADYRHQQNLHRIWYENNKQWQKNEYGRELLAAIQEGRQRVYATPDDVPTLGGEPRVPREPHVAPYVAPPAQKGPMGLGTFALIVAAILVGWTFAGDFIVGLYIGLVVVLPIAFAASVAVFYSLQHKAASDPERLARMERWNPLTFALKAAAWFFMGCFRLFMRLLRM